MNRLNICQSGFSRPLRHNLQLAGEIVERVHFTGLAYLPGGMQGKVSRAAAIVQKSLSLPHEAPLIPLADDAPSGKTSPQRPPENPESVMSSIYRVHFFL